MGNEEIKKQKSQKYFSDLTRVNCTQNQTGNVDDLNEKIALRVSLSNIHKDSGYSIQLFNTVGGMNSPLCEPENLEKDNHGNAILKTSILIQYYFEKEQPLLVNVVRSKEGSVPDNYNITTTLGCIMGSRKNTLIKAIPQGKGENLVIAAEKIQQSEDVLDLAFEVTSNTKVDWREAKNKFVFKLNSGGNPVYKSECINDMAKFDKVKIPTGILAKGINITFHDCKNKTVANINTSIDELINRKIINVKMSNKRTFTLTSISRITRIFTFVDYLKAGVQIGLSVAIDFTGSNGNPSDPRSLHFIGGNQPTQYERAIYACGNIVAYYDYDQMFPCYGFGAKINNQPTPIFNLSLQADPNVHLIPNIIQEYHKALNVVKLWGPTNFGPILQTTNNIIRAENDKLKYNILMILTDGMIDDIDNTINELVNGSFLPLSVIIIGIGNADFSAMNVLDADENPLVSSQGIRAARDLVQFVPFNRFEADPQRLAQEVLAEIPRQIIQYYEMNNLDPIRLTT